MTLLLPYVRPGLPRSVFPSDFRTRTLLVFFPLRITYPSSLIPLYFIIVRVFGD
jgi:hypothetical protein